jgi:hypothetical protein
MEILGLKSRRVCIEDYRVRDFRGLSHTPHQIYTAVMIEEILIGLQLKGQPRRDYHTSIENVSITLLPHLFVIHPFLLHQFPQQRYSVHHLPQICSQSFEHTEFSPHYEH